MELKAAADFFSLRVSLSLFGLSIAQERIASCDVLSLLIGAIPSGQSGFAEPGGFWLAAFLQERAQHLPKPAKFSDCKGNIITLAGSVRSLLQKVLKKLLSEQLVFLTDFEPKLFFVRAHSKCDLQCEMYASLEDC